MSNPFRLFKVFLVCLFLLAAITSCQLRTAPEPTTEPIPIPITETATVITEIIQTDNLPIRIRLVTTSDWTDFKIISGADFSNPKLISSSSEALTAEIEENHLILDQELSRSETGAQVEMVVEGQLDFWKGNEGILFEVERGDIGMTMLEISRQVNNNWIVIKFFSWDGVKGDGRNAFKITYAPGELLSNEPIEVVEIPTSIPSEIVFVPQINAASPVSPIIGMPAGSDGFPWWNDSIFYEIFVRSFYDSNNDGIGDFVGITQKLDYLNDGNPDTTHDLGISGIWLMPINPSPSYHGYNVTDYYAVNPQFGTMEEFKALLSEAHAHGIRVIIDMVLNHTSIDHPWFQAAADSSSPYHDWYIWSDVDPGYSGSWGQQVWFPYKGKFYYSTFSAGMPDLNYNNPEVTAEMQDVFRFWLEVVGVDGFRLDASKHLIEEGTIQANSQSTHEWYKNFYPVYKEMNPDALVVGEVWEETAIMSDYLQGNELDLSFEFYLAGSIIKAINQANVSQLNQQMSRTNKLIPNQRFAPFLSNHDQERVMSQFRGDTNKAIIASAVLLTTPGVPFLYYGEEIGMQGLKPDPQIRTPMQWSSADFAGFSTVEPWQPVNPDRETVNVATENDSDSSLLSIYRTLIQARNQHVALRVGDLNLINTGNKALYSLLRVSLQESVLVLINLENEPITSYGLSLINSRLTAGEYHLLPIVGQGEFSPLTVNTQGGFTSYQPLPEIPAFAVMVLQIISP